MRRLQEALGRLNDLLNDPSSGVGRLPQRAVKLLEQSRDNLEDYLLGQTIVRTQKLDLYGFLLRREPSQPFTFSVWHQDGFRYASDSYLIAKIKEEYPPEVEGCLVDKGGVVHAKKEGFAPVKGVPDYEQVIKKVTETPERDLVWVQFDHEKFQNLTKKIRLADKTKQKVRFLVRTEDLENGGVWISHADLFLKFYQMAKQLGADGFYWFNSALPGFITVGENFLGIAPIVKIVEEAMADVYETDITEI